VTLETLNELCRAQVRIAATLVADGAKRCIKAPLDNEEPELAAALRPAAFLGASAKVITI
jgi:hypothetical protein